MEMVWQKALDVLKPSPEQLEHGLELHKNFMVCDNFGFCPKPWPKDIVEYMNGLIKEGVGQYLWSERSTMYRIHGFTKWQEGLDEFILALKCAGINGLVQTAGGGENFQYTIQNMAAHQHLCRMAREQLSQAGSAAEIREAAEKDRTALIFSVNGPPPVGDMGDPDNKLHWIDVWYHLGVRFMHLSYNRRNEAADGCTEPAGAGLSDYGYELIHKMNEVGITVDTPHSSLQTTLDACKASEKAVTATHIGVKALMDHPRCKTDEELKAIADTGGMIGIYAIGGMLGKGATINTMLDHLDYAKNLIGAEHVSIGTDICYQTEWPKEVKRYPAEKNLSDRRGSWKQEHRTYHTEEHLKGSLAWTNWPLYTVGMVMRGYSDSDIEKILGLNLMRVMEANEPQQYPISNKE
jgi:membrane dipeptidase